MTGRIVESSTPYGHRDHFIRNRMTILQEKTIRGLDELDAGFARFQTAAAQATPAVQALARAYQVPLRLVVGPVPAKAAHRRRYQKRR